MCIANKSESKNMSLLGELKNPNLCGCFDHCNWSVIALTPNPDQTPTNEQVQTTCK